MHRFERGDRRTRQYLDRRLGHAAIAAADLHRIPDAGDDLCAQREACLLYTSRCV